MRIDPEEAKAIIERVTQEIRDGVHGDLGPNDEQLEASLRRKKWLRDKRVDDAIKYIRDQRNK